MLTDIIILAGGFGERLWPASTADYPKQFLAVNDDLSFLQSAVSRALALHPTGKIIIATRYGIHEEIATQCLQLSEKVNACSKQKIQQDLIILVEPQSKHTAAPIVLSCYILKLLNHDISHNVLVLTSDHIISPVESFIADVTKAFMAVQKDYFVTFGIKPRCPSSAYGYIQIDELKPSPAGAKIKTFKEKPDQNTAIKYFSSPHYWWNSGMFAFNCDFFLNELKQCTPEIAEVFDDNINTSFLPLEDVHGIPAIMHWNEMINAYNVVPAIALDVAVAEKTKYAYMVPASFEWDDVGTWDAFARYAVDKTPCALIDSMNCFVYSDMPVAVCGVNDINVIIKNGIALIMKKNQDLLIKEAIRKLK